MQVNLSVYKKLIFDAISLLLCVYFYIKEFRQIMNSLDMNNFRPNGSFVIFYLRFLLLFLLPGFFMAKVYNYFADYGEDSQEFVGLKYFFNAMYIILTILTTWELVINILPNM